MLFCAVVGASRGIGLCFVRQLSLNQNTTVFALVRNREQATALQDFVNSNAKENVHIIQANLDDFKSLKNASAEVSAMTGGVLDMLIINGALCYHKRDPLTLDAYPDEETLEQDMMQFFKTNVIGVTHTINTFLPLIQAGETRKVLVITSAVSSTKYIIEHDIANLGPYSISKAAVNMVVAKYAITFKDIIFTALTPGFVRTHEGAEWDAMYDQVSALIRHSNPTYPGPNTAEKAVYELLALIVKLTLSESGMFLRRDGKDGGLPEFHS